MVAVWILGYICFVESQLVSLCSPFLISQDREIRLYVTSPSGCQIITHRNDTPPLVKWLLLLAQWEGSQPRLVPPLMNLLVPNSSMKVPR